MATHRIAATPENVRWGVFDAAISPQSGAEVPSRHHRTPSITPAIGFSP